ncbi:MAG: septum formation initiator family protein [Gordonia sp. (in: high G+C Gram-positive bacteria)]|uniref:FtsB family cell division protein n=1 Tax=Gordonia sp. (in: high G+C Gram-positive bacteria) TaxID=84139 RepID=UPI0039E28BD7
MAVESGRSRRARSTGRSHAPGSARPAVRRARTRAPGSSSTTSAEIPVEENVDVPEGDDLFEETPAATRTSHGLRERLSSVNPKRALGLLAMIVFLALTLAVPVRTYFGQRAEFNRLTESNRELATEVEQYQRQITEQNDPAFIENQARERLQMYFPGEKPVVMSYPAREKQQEADRQAREYTANPWYENLWDAVATPPPVGK